MDKQSILQLHTAVQYISTAGKNYVAHKADDSHTNSGWNPETSSFYSWPFTTGGSLSFHTKRMELEWIGDVPGTFALIGRTHAEVIRWLEEMSLKNSLKKFVFNLHYDLGFVIEDDFKFVAQDPDFIDAHAECRTASLHACNEVLRQMDLTSDVRTWPHHFDTGAFSTFPEDDFSFGFGLAIPDALSEDFYLYCSAYKGNEGVETNNLPTLSKGEWKQGNWKGALLTASNLRRSDFHLFFFESIDAFKQKEL